MKDETRSGILACGNWLLDHVKLVDHYPEQDQLASILEETTGNGGGPYNLLKDLAKLGFTHPMQACGCLGQDPDGERIIADCQAHGIDPSQLHRRNERPTSYTVVISVLSTGRRTFFHQRGANALLDVEHVDLDRTNARWLYVGYPLLLDSLDRPDPEYGSRHGRLLAAARQRGIKTVVDLVSCPGDFQGIVWPVLRHIDVLLLNEWEARQLTGVEVKPDRVFRPEAVMEVCLHIRQRGGCQAVVLHLEEGAVAETPQGTFVQRSVRVPAESIRGTNGAGDAFAAGLMFCLHDGADWQDALRTGCAVAASCMRSPTTSDGIDSMKEVMARASLWGWHH